MKLRHFTVCGGLLAVTIIGFIPVTVLAAQAAKEAKPAVSEEAAGDLLRMGQTLHQEVFSFQVRSIRVYSGAGGEPLHIFHTMKVTVHQPSHLLVEVTGDDGSTKLAFDGKTAIVYSAAQNK